MAKQNHSADAPAGRRAPLLLAAWLLRDGVWRYQSFILFRIFLTGLAALFSQLAAFAVIFFYAHGLETNREVDVLGTVVHLRSSWPALLITAATVFVLLVLYAWLNYYSRTRILDLRRQYEEFCARRQMVLTSRLPHPACPRGNRLLIENALGKFGKREVRACARALMYLAASLMPAGRLVLSAVVLLFISLPLSSIILVIGLLSLWLLYLAGRATAQTTRLAEAHGTQASREKYRLLRRLWDSPAPLDEQSAELSAMFERGDTFKMLNAFFGRFRWRERISLLLNLMGSVAVLCIVLAAGWRLMTENQNWSVFVAYLTALRFYLANLMQLGRALSLFSRLYPQVRRYREFVQEIETRTQSSTQLPGSRSILLDVPSLEDGSKPLLLKPGQTIYVFKRGPPTRLLAAQLQYRTLPSPDSAPGSYWFVGELDCAGSTLREFFGLGRDVTEAASRTALQKLLPIVPPDKLLPISLDQELDHHRTPDLNPEILLALALWQGLKENRTAFIVSDKQLRHMDQAAIAEIRKVLEQHVLILKRNQIDRVGKSPSICLLAGPNRDLAGWCTGDWLLQHPEQARKIVFGGEEEVPAAVDLEDEDEEEDLDEDEF